MKMKQFRFYDTKDKFENDVWDALMEHFADN